MCLDLPPWEMGTLWKDGHFGGTVVGIELSKRVLTVLAVRILFSSVSCCSCHFDILCMNRNSQQPCQGSEANPSELPALPFFQLIRPHPVLCIYW